MALASRLVAFLSVALAASTALIGDDRKSPTPDLPTNDPLLKDQWHLFDTKSPHGRPGSINAVGAWKLVRPAKPIVVALLDIGVNWTHPDLANNIWRNPGETRADADDDPDIPAAARHLNGEDDDKNGYVDDVVGWDFAGNDYNPNSEPFGNQNDHGSLMAGLMAAVPDNKIGVAGVGRNIRVMPLRVAGDFKANLRNTVPAAIRYAVRNGARVIVSAVYLPPDLQRHAAFREAMEEAQKKNVLVVLGANRGRGGKLDTEEMKTVASYPNVLVVGCARKDGSLLLLDDPQAVVQVVAPCEAMPSIAWGGYETWDGPGISLATPVVAAAAATLLSQEPKLTPKEVIERVQKTARRHPSMDGKMKAGGSLDMEALLKSVRR